MRDAATQDSDHHRLDHRQREERRHRRVNGIAAGQQHLGASRRRQWMVGHHHATRAGRRPLLAGKRKRMSHRLARRGHDAPSSLLSLPVTCAAVNRTHLYCPRCQMKRKSPCGVDELMAGPDRSICRPRKLCVALLSARSLFCPRNWQDKASRRGRLQRETDGSDCSYPDTVCSFGVVGKSAIPPAAAQQACERQRRQRREGHQVERIDVADHGGLAVDLVRQPQQPGRRLDVPGLRQARETSARSGRASMNSVMRA